VDRWQEPFLEIDDEEHGTAGVEQHGGFPFPTSIGGAASRREPGMRTCLPPAR
jgi:hypothetical protein